MGALIRSHEWHKTVLGAPDTWPQSLRTVATIVATSRYAMWLGWGKDLNFFYNDAYAPTLGLKHPWALGRPGGEVWAEIWKDIYPRIDSVLSTGEATYDEGLMLFLERSGFPEETYHTFSYSPVADDTGSISGMLCVVTEETDRIINERRMATLRDLASSLASSITEDEVCSALAQQLGANSKDLPFTLAYLYNENGEAHLHCSTNMPQGHAAAQLVIEPNGDSPWPASEMLDRPGLRVVDLNFDELPMGAWDKPPKLAALVPIRQQGHERPAGFLVAGINPYRRYDDSYSGFIDLIVGQLAAGLANARSYAEERLRADGLAELDRAKTTFFSNVSHEFRTPLTLMLGPVEDLLVQNQTDENRGLLEVVHRSGLRLQRLVNTLLDFSRIEAGRAQANYQPVELASMTAELASSFSSAMDRAGLEFTVDSQTLRAPVMVDRDMWEKIVLNLLSNAFKYTLEGAIAVKLVEREGHVELSVTDTGVGIPSEELPRLFERFHRVEQTRGRTHEGTGIGLALVQELVKLHKGTVSVTSELGRGTTFTVELQFGSEHLPQDRIGKESQNSSTALHADAYVEEALRWLPEIAADVKPAKGVRSRVLLADDNGDMREYVRRLLAEEYEVVTTSNGAEALASALAQPPDLVVTDVMMPVMDGFGLLAELRNEPKTRAIPVILLSARAGEEAKLEGLQSGADDYLVKPFSARELMARVGSHLALRKERQRAQERLTQIFVQAPVGIIVMRGRNFMVELANPAYEAIVQRKDLVGRPLRESLPEVGDNVWDAFNSVLDTGKPFIVNEFHVPFDQNADGVNEDHWFNVVYHPLQESDGPVSGIIAVITEVTGQVRARLELEKANRELEEFAYVSSHDLQEPLRMVSIYSQLLLEEFPDAGEDAHVYAEFVREGVERMEALLKDLLTYSRIVHPEQEDARSTDLNESLHEALQVLRVRIQETSAEIFSDKLPSVVGESRQIALIFQNLLSNAMKYSRDGQPPRIRITATEQDDHWVVHVKDDGIGFDPKHSERIFGLFKRLHKSGYPGTGLGLAISKRIVERYGGKIWAESHGDGKGAVFSFSFKKLGR